MINFTLCRTIHSKGNRIDFYLSKTRNHKPAKRFFKKILQAFYISSLCVIAVNKNQTSFIAIKELKNEKKIPIGIELRKDKYRNNIVEQGH
ncbi:DDE-type integrase/transposase/recombinase (plasmid) [Bacillus sp. N447-1]|nr:DDE-type integrase/transposase/recombinase [Bacillus sp. N447-1]